MEKGGRQGIRKGNWKAVKYDMSDDPDAPIQLFDLSKDIGEENDLSASHPEIIAEMQQLMKNARTPSQDFRFKYEDE